MSTYRVLYRKYRPKVFDDVVGQPQVTVTLKNELKSGRVNHAYLFTGTRGTGKTTCAKILSKAVNCLSPNEGDPCCQCEICKGIENGEIFDVIEMDAASNRRLDDIRDVIEKVSYTPERGSYRVFIIDEVHMLTNEAFNALLKTLEEPPQHVIFILATTEVHKLPATIMSRCQRFDFHRIKPQDVASRIKYVAELENTTVTDEAALLIAVIADGAMRDALSLFDRCIGISSSVDADIVRRAAGLAGKESLLDIVSSCVNKNTERALSTLNKLHSESKDMMRLCDEIINHFRSLMMIKSVRNPRDLVVLSDSEYEIAFDQAQMLSLADIVYAMDVLGKAFERMGKGSDNRTELEIALVKLSAPELDASTEALLTRISALEKTIKLLGSNPQPVYTEPKEEKSEEKKEEAKPTVIPQKEEKPVPLSTPKPYEAVKAEPKTEIKAQPPKALKREPVDMSAIMADAKPLKSWPEVVDNLKQYSRVIASSFEGTTAYASGDYLLIDAKTDIPFKLLQNSSQRENLRNAVQEITGKRYILGPYKRAEEKQEKKDPLEELIAELKESDIEILEN
ncbi:MAG: DNA polymerase III subunit gamma/tau [Ruminococcus sp.]|nr:DNA polymerase III subunit gamma/tau [Ruminococcus sp.]